MRPERSLTHFFTVDVEEYFQVKAMESLVSQRDWLSRPSRIAHSIDELLRILDGHQVKGTFFVLGWLADRAGVSSGVRYKSRK